MAGDRGNRRVVLRRPIQESAEDSGIDSDEEVQRMRVDFDLGLVECEFDFGKNYEDLLWRQDLAKALQDCEDEIDEMMDEAANSDSELVLKSSLPKFPKKHYDDPLENKEEGNASREMLLPMVVRQRPRFDNGDTVAPGTPDRSSPPLYEVELTASDEDDDGSVLELVIPLQSSRYNRANKNKPRSTTAYFVASLFCSIFRCFRVKN